MTKEQLALAMPHALPTTIDKYFDAIVAKTTEAGIDTPLRLAHWLAQIAHETGDMHAVEENLNYSADALTRTWPSLFNATNAAQYAHRPDAIADRAYGNRYGNGTEASGDGWRYRGRGFLQITFKCNYAAYSKATGFDYVANPDLVSQDAGACVGTATWFWTAHSLNAVADADDVVKLRRIVNGGAIGLDDVKVRLVAIKHVLGVA